MLMAALMMQFDMDADPTQTANQAVSLLEQLGLNVTPFWKDMLIAAVILATFLVLALIARLTFRTVLRRLTAHTTGQLDDRLIATVEGPTIAFLILTGVMTALLSIDMLQNYDSHITRGYAIVAIILGFVTVARVVRHSIDWYAHRAAEAAAGTAQHYASLTRKIVTIVIWVIGIVIVLGQLVP